MHSKPHAARHALLGCLAAATLLLAPAPPVFAAGETCPQPCLLDCILGPANTNFEDSLANVYQSFGFAGFNPDTSDLDGNGIIDRAQARLVDAVLADAGGANSCCLMGVYQNNAASAATLAESLYGDNDFIGSLSRTDFEAILAGITTQGEAVCINAMVTLLEAHSGIAEIDLTGFYTSNDTWLASYGDQDFDGVCNIGEYNATVSNAADFDAFVTAAMEFSIATNGGGCPPCAEGEGDNEGEGEGLIEGIVEGGGEGVIEGGIEGTPEGLIEGEGTIEGEGAIEGIVEGEGSIEGLPEGEGTIEGTPEGSPEGIVEGLPEGEGTIEGEGAIEGEGSPEGIVEGVEEGTIDGEGIAEGEGVADGEGVTEGEGEPALQSADQDGDQQISLQEALRVIQFYNAAALHCDDTTEDNYAPGVGDTTCPPHDTDYNPLDWTLSLSELLRLIQFYNNNGYRPCPQTGEDGYCPGV